MDFAWLVAVVVFFGGCDLATRLLANLQSED
jgi:hypothetical protein